MIRIDLSENKVKAWITVLEAESGFPTYEQILSEINNKNICFGINENTLQKIASSKKPVRKILFAQGNSPVPGTDASIEWKIDLNKPTAKNVPGSDRVDFKQINFSESVNQGQVLAKKNPAGTGKDGTSVLGETIPSFGVDYSLPKGRNTYISDDGLTLYAEISGSAFVENCLIHVDNIFHVKGNVSYATGNIKFNGPVVIEGDVLSGFRVEARDSIYIGGNVEAAHVYSQQGDITINYGVLGQGRAKILAGGSLKCGYIQDATVSIRKDVSIDHYILNSTLTCGGKVELINNEGLIRGGIITAEKGVEVIEAGSDRNVYTEIHIRNQGENESQNELWELSRKRSELSVRLNGLKKRKTFLTMLDENTDKLSAEKVGELTFVDSEIERINLKIEALNTEEMEIQKNASMVRLTREVLIHKTMHKNVNVDIGGVNYHSNSSVDGIKLFRFKSEIIIESLLDMDDGAYDIFVPSTTD